MVSENDCDKVNEKQTYLYFYQQIFVFILPSFRVSYLWEERNSYGEKIEGSKTAMTKLNLK